MLVGSVLRIYHSLRDIWGDLVADQHIDYEARTLAKLALQKTETLEKFCEERARKAELFETEMRSAVNNINESVKGGLTRIHSRFDTLIFWGLTTAVGAVIAGGGCIIIYLLNKDV